MNECSTPWPRMLVGHVPIDLLDRDAALELIFGALSDSDPIAVASANLDHIHHFAGDASWDARTPVAPTGGLRWLTLLDGMPLVRTANARSGRSWPKLSGSDLITPILERAAATRARVAFLGGTAETHQLLLPVLAERHPRLEVAGTWAPERAELTDRSASEAIAAQIKAAEADILVVGLGKPRQERWIADYGTQTGAQALLAFGAVVDFLACRVARVPERVSNVGGEWAWRLMLEPRRLARRYLVQGPPALVRLKRSAVVLEAAPASA
ncbi:WecB/TagA/CpsF family glycosyltransferase [Nocardia sp. NPDC051030]|uniref:WecB/TagA/CpsF family glycosyltransferase n=1 Tax=Nocardia sp. NPDC051030 TaxID=3155162 RepID=UPI0034342EF8